MNEAGNWVLGQELRSPEEVEAAKADGYGVVLVVTPLLIALACEATHSRKRPKWEDALMRQAEARDAALRTTRAVFLLPREVNEQIEGEER